MESLVDRQEENKEAVGALVSAKKAPIWAHKRLLSGQGRVWTSAAELADPSFWSIAGPPTCNLAPYCP